MANRYTTQFVNTIAKGVNKIFCYVTFGGGGAPTIVNSSFQSQGIVSVTHDGTGQYTFVFGTQAGMLDVYYKLLGVQVLFDATANSGTAPAAPFFYLTANSVSTPGTCSLQLTFLDADTPAATDPVSGEAAYFEFTFKNSTAP